MDGMGLELEVCIRWRLRGRGLEEELRCWVWLSVERLGVVWNGIGCWVPGERDMDRGCDRWLWISFALNLVLRSMDL